MGENAYITLQPALKKYDLVQSGGHAKIVIQNGEVFVDGEKEERRGRKLYGGEKITYLGKSVIVSDAH